MRLRLAKSGMVGKSLNWRGAAEAFSQFPVCLHFFINNNRNMLLQRKQAKIALFLRIAAKKVG
jgi:hypothetical protein